MMRLYSSMDLSLRNCCYCCYCTLKRMLIMLIELLLIMTVNVLLCCLMIFDFPEGFEFIV